MIRLKSKKNSIIAFAPSTPFRLVEKRGEKYLLVKLALDPVQATQLGAQTLTYEVSTRNRNLPTTLQGVSSASQISNAIETSSERLKSSEGTYEGSVITAGERSVASLLSFNSNFGTSGGLPVIGYYEALRPGDPEYDTAIGIPQVRNFEDSRLDSFFAGDTLPSSVTPDPDLLKTFSSSPDRGVTTVASLGLYPYPVPSSFTSAVLFEQLGATSSPKERRKPDLLRDDDFIPTSVPPVTVAQEISTVPGEYRTQNTVTDVLSVSSGYDSKIAGSIPSSGKLSSVYQSLVAFDASEPEKIASSPAQLQRVPVILEIPFESSVREPIVTLNIRDSAGNLLTTISRKASLTGSEKILSTPTIPPTVTAVLQSQGLLTIGVTQNDDRSNSVGVFIKERFDQNFQQIDSFTLSAGEAEEIEYQVASQSREVIVRAVSFGASGEPTPAFFDQPVRTYEAEVTKTPAVNAKAFIQALDTSQKMQVDVITRVPASVGSVSQESAYEALMLRRFLQGTYGYDDPGSGTYVIDESTNFTQVIEPGGTFSDTVDPGLYTYVIDGVKEDGEYVSNVKNIRVVVTGLTAEFCTKRNQKTVIYSDTNSLLNTDKLTAAIEYKLLSADVESGINTTGIRFKTRINVPKDYAAKIYPASLMIKFELQDFTQADFDAKDYIEESSLDVENGMLDVLFRIPNEDPDLPEEVRGLLRPSRNRPPITSLGLSVVMDTRSKRFAACGESPAPESDPILALESRTLTREEEGAALSQSLRSLSATGLDNLATALRK